MVLFNFFMLLIVKHFSYSTIVAVVNVLYKYIAFNAFPFLTPSSNLGGSAFGCPAHPCPAGAQQGPAAQEGF